VETPPWAGTSTGNYTVGSESRAGFGPTGGQQPFAISSQMGVCVFPPQTCTWTNNWPGRCSSHSLPSPAALATCPYYHMPPAALVVQQGSGTISIWYTGYVPSGGAAVVASEGIAWGVPGHALYTPSGSEAVPPSGFSVAGFADVNGDGLPDVILQN